MKHISILAIIAIATFGFTETKTYTLDEAVKTALTKNNQVLSSIEAVKSAEGKEVLCYLRQTLFFPLFSGASP